MQYTPTRRDNPIRLNRFRPLMAAMLFTASVASGCVPAAAARLLNRPVTNPVTVTSAAIPNTFHTGSGNFQSGQSDAEAQMQLLKAAGADTCRVCVYQGDYGIDGPPNPADLDATIALCTKYGLKPIVLFENYGQTAGGYGTYATWKATGAAYAAHFGSHVLAYTAFNEPDGDGPNGTNVIGGPKIPTALYHDCLEGLSDGVKGVNSALLVAPGGFTKPNSMSDWTCEGYLPAIADLFNDHKLDAIDLHQYTNGMLAPNNMGPAPLGLSYTGTAPQFSCQNAFDSCKQACGITSDPQFMTTEFNYTSPTDSADGARGFLTVFFDAQGVVGNDGVTRKTIAALVWQIQTQDAPRLKALSVAMGLQGATYAALDPSLLRARRTGTYTFKMPNGNYACVWQDRGYGWSTLADLNSSSITLQGVPTTATHIDVYDATGLRTDLSIATTVSTANVIVGSLGASRAAPVASGLQSDARPSRQALTGTVTVSGLPGGQTFIFVAR
jgi:hypothetical protein